MEGIFEVAEKLCAVNPGTGKKEMKEIRPPTYINPE